MKSLLEQDVQDVTFLCNEKCWKDMSKVLSYGINIWFSDSPEELIKHLQQL